MGTSEMIPFPDKKYQIIYADCPWGYGFSGTRKKIVYPTYNRYIKKADDYETMKTKDICKLPVKNITDKKIAENALNESKEKFSNLLKKINKK